MVNAVPCKNPGFPWQRMQMFYRASHVNSCLGIWFTLTAYLLVWYLSFLYFRGTSQNIRLAIGVQMNTLLKGHLQLLLGIKEGGVGINGTGDARSGKMIHAAAK